jgi:6-phosphofructokinase
MLDRIRTAAHDVGRIAVVEVPGYQSGWLALRAGMAICADAVLIPEVRYDLRKLVATLSGKQGARPVGAVVVIAEGATPSFTPPMPPAFLVEYSMRINTAVSYNFTGRMHRHFSIIIEFGCKTEYQPHLIDIGLFGNPPSRPQTITHFRFRSHDRRALGANNRGRMRGHR